jgi:ABC-type dipeptide/oligopeptide/nickel transport system permease subunit
MSVTELQPPPTGEPVTGVAVEGRSALQIAWARVRKDKAAITAMVFIAVVVLIAIAAPVLVKWIGWDPVTGDRTFGTTADGLPIGPNGHHLLGTDRLGRDLLSRTIYGARVSLLVGLSATLLATVGGVVVGMIAGFYGGATDTALSRIMDVTLSFPYLLMAVALAAAFGGSTQLTILVIAFFSWAAIGRIVRGQVLSLREKEFVEAARSLGASKLRIMFIDILPNLVAPVTVLASMTIPASIIFESTLSFLGAGIDPRTPSWGNMLADATDVYQEAWWTLVVPASALLLTTLAFNIVGDAVRDALDPRSERIFAGQRSRRRRNKKNRGN